MKQDDIFKKIEGDKWFERNADYLKNPEMLEKDIPLQLIHQHNLKPKKVLEIGSANGFRLQEIKRRFASDCTGIDLSQKAIEDGKKNFPNINLIRAAATELPFSPAGFDLIIINFVFLWIDRSNLLKTVSEIDRVLMNKGFLLVGDFYPSQPTKVQYHHLPEKNVFTYTQNYAEIFTASKMYSPIVLVTGDHSTHKITSTADPDRRFGVFLLQKDLDSQYIYKKLKQRTSKRK